MVVASAVPAWTWYGSVVRFVHAIETAAITVEPNCLLTTAGQIAAAGGRPAEAPAEAVSAAAADIRGAAATRSIADLGAG